MDKFDFKTVVMLIVGACLGTLIKSLRSPERHIGRWVVQVLIALAVGVIAGGAVIEYFGFEGFRAAAAGAVFALLSEEIVRGVQSRGRRVARGDFTMSPEVDDDD